MDNIATTKLIESLSTCPTLQDSFMTSLVKSHEKSGTVCAKYYYDLYLRLNKNGDTYKLLHAEINFLENSNLANKDVIGILDDFNKEAGVSTSSGDVFHDSFLALITIYSRTAYHYLFLSVITDYSIDASLVHQCALLVDLREGRFLFYEPYGKYSKYNADYSPAVVEFLEQYQFPAKFYENGKLRFDTWHHYFNLPIGIQSIVLDAHNQQREQYELDKQQYIANLRRTNPEMAKHIIAQLERGKDAPVHKDDYTFDTLEIAGYFGKYCDSDGQAENGALELYYKYNSKTCVTITITELDYFFTNLATLSFTDQHNALLAYYNEFAQQKNKKLVVRLNEFISSAMNPNEIQSLMKLPLCRVCRE